MKKRLCNEWLKAALIRAARTFFQTLAATASAEAVRLDQIEWLPALSISATAAIFSLITSFATGLPEAEEE